MEEEEAENGEDSIGVETRKNGGLEKGQASAGARFSGLERDLSNRFKTGG